MPLRDSFSRARRATSPCPLFTTPCWSASPILSRDGFWGNAVAIGTAARALVVTVDVGDWLSERSIFQRRRVVGTLAMRRWQPAAPRPCLRHAANSSIQRRPFVRGPGTVRADVRLSRSAGKNWGYRAPIDSFGTGLARCHRLATVYAMVRRTETIVAKGLAGIPSDVAVTGESCR